MFLFGGVEVILVVVVGLILLGVTAVATGRGEPDPSGARPYAVYLTSITFVALFVLLVSGFNVVREVAELGIADEQTSSGLVGFGSGETCTVTSDGTEECTTTMGGPGIDLVQGFPQDDDQNISAAVRAATIGALAAGLLLLHRKRLRDLTVQEDILTSPAGRVALINSYVVAFVSALIVLGAGAAAAYSIFRIAAPGITGFGDSGFERDAGIVALLSSGTLLVFSTWIFSNHWKRADAIRGLRQVSPAVEE